MRSRSYNRIVQSIALDIVDFHDRFVMWDEDHGRIVDENGVVHCHVVVKGSALDGSSECVFSNNANACANGVYVKPNTTITCIACLARGPALPRK